MSYYCHSCSTIVSAITSADGELRCSSCQGPFIEIVEDSSHPEASQPPTRPAEFRPVPPTRRTPAERGTATSFVFSMPPTSQSGAPLFDFAMQILGQLTGSLSGGGSSSSSRSNMGGTASESQSHDPLGQISQWIHRLMTGEDPTSEAYLREMRPRKATETEICEGKECAICLDCLNEVPDHPSEEDADPETRRENNSSPSRREGGVPGELPDLLDLPCNHVFHRECLKQWLKKHNVCPTCRHKLPSQWSEHGPFSPNSFFFERSFPPHPPPSSSASPSSSSM